MRFIFNFIFFGILFYLIYVYFPDPFHMLVSWADAIVTFAKETFHVVVEKVQSLSHHSATPS